MKIAPVGGMPAATPMDAAMAAKDAKLRKAAQQVEGAFVQQMYKTMRETVPTDGAFSGGSGEEMFTGLLDQHVASDTPMQWKRHGLSESIYRQMRDAVHQQVGTTLPPDSIPAPSGADNT
ncbi:MAG TPA: rod-binding protein [Candidatus Elarobacter sp.]|nr:rod-binding protein [Candidatus Elarobacter sp.]